MSFRYVREPALSRANQAPDRIVAAEGSNREHLPEADLVAVLRELEIGAVFDTQLQAQLDRERDLSLGGYFY
ncbi:MAG TPA: hypothetical protein VLK65_05910 [Vicinamibacteria bacterium]|nr:hypothetical protein [Vicinamibacteria bacterium]